MEMDWLWAQWDGLGSLSTVGWIGIGMDWGSLGTVGWIGIGDGDGLALGMAGWVGIFEH